MMTVCEICGKEESRYVCSNCARRIGLSCFTREGWLCKDCAGKGSFQAESSEIRSEMPTTMWLFFLAFVLITAGVILLSLSSTSRGQSFIVLFPFIFGTSNGTGLLLLIPAATIAILMLLIAYLTMRKNPKRER